MITNHSAIELYNLTIAYDNKTVLHNICATIPRAVMLAIIGPNGAGKTTLLKYLVGLIKAHSGTTLIFNQPHHQMRSAIAYVPQRSSVDWDFPLHAIDVVLMGCYARLGWFARPGKSEYTAAYACLERVGMLQQAQTPISQLSGGQQQRLFIARALLQDAPLYLLDEPFNGIDATTEQIILTLLQELRNNGKTVVIVHHDLHTVQSYFDWTLLINNSNAACGPVEKIFTQQHLQNAFGNHALFAHLNP